MRVKLARRLGGSYIELVAEQNEIGAGCLNALSLVIRGMVKAEAQSLRKEHNMSSENASTECCPKFDPAPWDEKTFEWDNKRFIKDKVLTFFYIPLNFGRVVKRMMARIENAGAKAQDWMGLSDHTSRWKMDLYVAVDREIPGAQNATLSGQFVSKVYEGAFKETGNWCKDFAGYVKAKNLDVRKWYMWYTTCPKCAKKYGKNYVVIIGRVG